MISNKEKRLSQAFDVYANSGLDGPAPALPPMVNHHKHHLTHHHPFPHPNHIAPYGMIGSAANHSANNNGTGSSGSVSRTALDHHPMLMGKKSTAHLLNNERNSHSLSHDFSAMYISNLKSKHSQAKRSGVNGASSTLAALPSLEEMNSAKRDAAQAKKQMMQMEKSITYWSDCTEYWRSKWRKTRDEKKSAREELKALKARLNKVEGQLAVSEDRRARLTDEVKMLHGELSRYVYHENEVMIEGGKGGGGHRRTQQQSAVQHYNSDRRVDYRRQRRKQTDLPSSSKIRNDHQHLSSTEEEEFHQPHRFASESSGRLRGEPLQRFLVNKASSTSRAAAKADQLYLPSTSSSAINNKVVMRNHERLFDKKIANRKRFSQVVMCDEEEIFQLNEAIPAINNNNNSLRSKNSDNNTLKYHAEAADQQLPPNATDSVHTTDSASYQQRFMEHVPEEEEEEEGGCFGEEDEEEEEDKEGDEEEEDSSDQFCRRKRSHRHHSKHQSGHHQNQLNHSNLSTMATSNSECANVGSIREDDLDEDSFRSTEAPAVPQHRDQQQNVPASSKSLAPADGIFLDDRNVIQNENDDDEDDEV